MNRSFRIVRCLGVLLAAGMASACAILRHTGSAECPSPPSTPLLPFAPARALALAGTYNVIIVSDSGPHAGRVARATLSLAATDTLHRYYIKAFGQEWRRRGDRPLMGWGSIRGDVGLMTAGTPVESRDPEQPGVLVGLDSLKGGLRFMLGYQPMNDGGYNEFIVTAADKQRFTGRWSSSLGPTDYRATGYFCARRQLPNP